MSYPQHSPRPSKRIGFFRALTRLLFGETSNGVTGVSDSGYWEAGKYEPVGVSKWPVRNDELAVPLFGIEVFREGLDNSEDATRHPRANFPFTDPA